MCAELSVIQEPTRAAEDVQGRGCREGPTQGCLEANRHDWEAGSLGPGGKGVAGDCCLRLPCLGTEA